MIKLIFCVFIINAINIIVDGRTTKKCSCSGHNPCISSLSHLCYRPSSVCAGCEYSEEYPEGYNYVDISYSYGQTITQKIYQNGKLMGGCFQTKVCSERVPLDPRYRINSVITRQTETNTYATHGTHIMDFGRRNNNLFNDSENEAPEINSVNEIIEQGVYYYNQTVGNDVLIDINVDNNITIWIFDYISEELIYNVTDYDFFDVVNITNPQNPNGFIGIIFIINETTKATQFIIQSINEQEDEDEINNIYDNINEINNNISTLQINSDENSNNYNNIKVISILGLVFSVLNIIFLVVFLTTFIIKFNNINKILVKYVVLDEKQIYNEL